MKLVRDTSNLGEIEDRIMGRHLSEGVALFINPCASASAATHEPATPAKAARHQAEECQTGQKYEKREDPPERTQKQSTHKHLRLNGGSATLQPGLEVVDGG